MSPNRECPVRSRVSARGPSRAACVVASALASLLAGAAAAVQIDVAPGEVAVVENDLCSLAEAIENAASDAQLSNDDCPAGFFTDTIALAAGSTYTLATPLPTVTSRIVIDGNGARIARDTAVDCILGNGLQAGEHRLLTVVPAAGVTSLTLNDLTLQGGCADGSGAGNDGGAIWVSSAILSLNRVTIESSMARDKSGAIDTSAGAEVTIVDSTIRDNHGGGGAGGLGSGLGCLMMVERSTISDNTSGGDGGAGIGNRGLMTIVNSTISGNASSGIGGGGIGNDDSGTIEVVSSTIWGNSVTGIGGGGGIGNAGAITVKNSIVGGSALGGDCANFGTFGAEGVNFDTDGSCAAVDIFDFGQATPAELAIAGQLSGHGGPTRTHALGAGSVAIDVASDCTLLDGTTPISTDQRGVARPLDGDGDGDAVADCDAGAFERELPLFEDGFESGDTLAWSAAVP